MGERRGEREAGSSLFTLRGFTFALRSSIFTLRRRADDGVGVGLPHDAVEPAVEVVAEGAGAHHAEAVLLIQGIDLDYNIAHFGESG